MGTEVISKGNLIFKQGKTMSQLYLIVKGTVKVTAKKSSWNLEAGNIIGLLGCTSGKYVCDYEAVEDVTVFGFPFEEKKDLAGLLAQNDDYAGAFVMAAVKQTFVLLNTYVRFRNSCKEFKPYLEDLEEEYQQLCEESQIQPKMFRKVEGVEEFAKADTIEAARVDYYREMARLTLKELESFFQGRPFISQGEIYRASEMMVKVIKKNDEMQEYLDAYKDVLLDENKNDIFHLYFSFMREAARSGADYARAAEAMEDMLIFAKECGVYDSTLLMERAIEFKKFDPTESVNEREERLELFEKSKEMLKEEKGTCLEFILAYSGYDKEKAENFTNHMDKYRKLTDFYAVTEDVRKLRKVLTNGFFEIYELVFQKTLTETFIHPIIEMFLNFGFMDVQLIGLERAQELLEITKEIKKCSRGNVYTMYDWLRSIYNGKNEPSKNEFDLNYEANLIEEKKMGNITEEERQELLQDQWKKTEYELKNFFISACRVTNGKVSTYCPVLCEADLVGSMEKMLLTVDKIKECLNAVRSIDFSLFYREVLFSDPEHELNREYIQKEILPDIILMPNAGEKGLMWQETAGRKNDTAARMVYPILCAGEIETLMIENCGRFRWEMCRKIMGVRWNDVTEPSLTSEYADYIQYYRKNSALSADAKEKLKNAVRRAKNNYREVFVADYTTWVKFEAKGSIRMNKVAREIMFKYCPFAKEYRRELENSPIFKEMFSKYEIICQRHAKHYQVVYDKYLKAGGTITEELHNNLDFYGL